MDGWKDGGIDGWIDVWMMVGRQSPAQEASFDRLMPDMLALLQSGEHHGSRQKADT